MPILIKPFEQVDVKNPTGPKKWSIIQVSTGQVDENQVAQDIAEETTLNPAEAMMALRQLRKVVLRHLLAGETVSLGGWGSFRVTLSTQSVQTRAEVNAVNVKTVNIRFKPAAEFKADLQKATFAWVDKLAGVAQDNATTTPGGQEDEDDSGQGTFG